MARTLNSRYFDLLSRRVDGEFEYQAYAPRHTSATLVLFANGDEPVAAVSFVSPSATNTLVTRYGAANSFAALTNIDKGEYSLVLTNLTDVVRTPSARLDAQSGNCGLLKIDLLPKDIAVDKVNLPHDALNEVNEFLPSQSCTIQSDQRAGHLCLKLCGVVDGGAAVSVRADAGKRGTRLIVHVTASTNLPEMAAIFASGVSEWRPVDVFVRRVPKNNGRSTLVAMGGGYQHARGGQLFGGGNAGMGAFGAPATRGGGTFGVFAQSSAAVTAQSHVDVTSEAQVGNAQAATSVVGDRRVDVSTIQTSMSYAYTTPGARATLTLAIWHDLFAYDRLPQEAARALGAQLVDEALRRGVDALMGELDKCFLSDKCVVCVNKPPTYVLARCGHQCLCVTCKDSLSRLRSCPMCRARIVGCFEAAKIAAL